MGWPTIGAEIPFNFIAFLKELKVTWPCSKDELLRQMPTGPDGRMSFEGPVRMDALSKIPDREYQNPSDVQEEYQKAMQQQRS
ncbi:DUF2795 domain-containing protein [Streptomyces sp. NPDC001546]|uniref:DUF2795 domain-containing protein n=1 Tax=Streptomyces sp. NPDC001546 TaxID=3364585 RepID=UPI00369026D4